MIYKHVFGKIEIANYTNDLKYRASCLITENFAIIIFIMRIQ